MRSDSCVVNQIEVVLSVECQSAMDRFSLPLLVVGVADQPLQETSGEATRSGVGTLFRSEDWSIDVKRLDADPTTVGDRGEKVFRLLG
jgi:hypothetical protein